MYLTSKEDSSLIKLLYALVDKGETWKIQKTYILSELGDLIVLSNEDKDGKISVIEFSVHEKNLKIS